MTNGDAGDAPRPATRELEFRQFGPPRFAAFGGYIMRRWLALAKQHAEQGSTIDPSTRP